MSADSAPPLAVEVCDLVASYGARRILDRVSMRVGYGEIMVIMGGSGSGKSTLLRHLLALNTPVSGCTKTRLIASASATPQAC